MRLAANGTKDRATSVKQAESGKQLPTADKPIAPTWHVGRWIAVVIVVVLGAGLLRSMITNENYDWSSVGQYLFSVEVLQGVGVTVELTAISMALALVLGILLAVMRLSGNRLLSGVSWAYSWFFRGTPTLVQLVFFYNLSALYPRLTIGIPFLPAIGYLNTNSVITAMMAAILGLGMNEAAYMSEIMRAGIQAVDRGQSEAATALGMTAPRTMWRIVLPQALRIVIPPIGNEVIGMLKYTSLVSVLAISDLMFSVEQIYSRNFRPIPLLIVASIWYLVGTSILMVLQRRLEQRLLRDNVAAIRGGRKRTRERALGGEGASHG